MTERWKKMVENERLAATVGVPPTKVLRCDDAVTLLASQHRAFVRMVKKEMANIPFDIPRDNAERLASQQHLAVCRRILAALAKQGGKK